MDTIQATHPTLQPRPRLVVAEHDGRPVAEVPAEFLWDLVDYLSISRIAVSYAFHAPRFAVTFLRSSVPVAQQLLEEWAAKYRG